MEKKFVFTDQPPLDTDQPLLDTDQPLLDSDQSLCSKCQSINILSNYYNYFHVSICKSCKDNHMEEYSLLTKTEVKQDYLLTESN